ncbi:MAG: TIGR00341 family protein [Pirellulaceae bacterium]|nr:TIGR00341 family protein [Pirellulaceae bacterium]
MTSSAEPFAEYPADHSQDGIDSSQLGPREPSVALKFFLYFESDEKTLPKAIANAFPADDYTWTVVGAEPKFNFPPNATLVLYLTDDAIKRLVEGAIKNEWQLAPLPHPQSRQIRAGFGVSANLDEAIHDIKSAEGARAVDLLWCNETPVFNTVMIGDSAAWLTGVELSSRWLKRLGIFLSEARRARMHIPQPFDIISGKERKLRTAATGIVVLEHGNSTLLSRRMLAESSPADGMLHALVLAPRSRLEMLWFLLTTILLNIRGIKKLPDFAGHIKTSDLRITSPREIQYRVDGTSFSATELWLRVSKTSLQVFTGRYLSFGKEESANKEIFRTQSLPSFESRQELILRPLPFLRHATTDDFRELYLQLRENAQSTSGYFVLIVLSAMLAALGLYANSAPVIIGAMILAPLMAPIISLAMGLSRQDRSLATPASWTVFRGVGLAMGAAAIIACLLPLYPDTSEIRARVTPNLLDLGVAIISGIAGAYAHARQEVARSLAGVAIAVALVPPLVVAGIGIGSGQVWNFVGAFLLFLTNFVGILFAAAITFSLLGYAPLSKARKGLWFSMIMVLAVSIPLSVGFYRLVDSQRMEHRFKDLVVEGVKVSKATVTREGNRKLVKCQVLVNDAASSVQAFSDEELRQAVYREIRNRSRKKDLIVEIEWIYRSE